MSDFHVLRPWWFLACLPLLLLMLGLLQQRLTSYAWSKVCDAHLLPALLHHRGRTSRALALSLMSGSMLCMIIALAGPTWSKNKVPTYQQLKPRLILLDLSPAMLAQDLTPDRLTRAKFKIHDLLMHRNAGQYGLMVYADEPFVVSPITDDAQTIDVLLDSLTPSMMPVEGNRLEMALDEAKLMLTEMGIGFGEILVLTAQTPSAAAITAAKNLASQGYHLSVIPLHQDTTSLSAFTSLAKAGSGEMLRFTDSSHDIDKWLALEHKSAQYQLHRQEDIPLWRDEGRWFLIPALLLLLPVFRRGWLARFQS